MFSLKFCTAISARPHQDVAAMLEQGVHRHDEETGQAADDGAAAPPATGRIRSS